MKVELRHIKTFPRWWYFVGDGRAGVLKVNAECFVEAVERLGFRRCSYSDYLRAKKALRPVARDKDMIIELLLR